MISCSMEHRRITKYGVTTRAVRTVYYQSAVNIQQALYKTETCSRHARANTRKLRSIGRYKRGSLSCSMEHDAVNVAANSTCDVNERGGKQRCLACLFVHAARDGKLIKHALGTRAEKLGRTGREHISF